MFVLLNFGCLKRANNKVGSKEIIIKTATKRPFSKEYIIKKEITS